VEERHVAVVTGSSRGIGRAIATSLAHQGVTVIINYRESKEAADALVAELSTITKAVAVQADVTVREDVSRLRDTVVETFGQVDILVNNAGAIITPGPWRDLSAADWRRGLDASLTSTFLCTQAFAPTLLNRSRARVVNVTSTYAFIGVTSVIAYTTAKAGVINMTRAFAKELARQLLLSTQSLPATSTRR
jgi:3-oxoacyl-[acyl-carrier protein] reductase